MMKNLYKLFAAFAVLFFLGVPAIAQVEAKLFGLATNLEDGPVKSGRAEGMVITEQTILYSIDPITGGGTEIGPLTGYTRCTGLDFEPVTNELFAVCRSRDEVIESKTKVDSDIIGDILVNVDIATGQAIEIGPLSIQIEGRPFVTDISFRSDGRLYAHVNNISFNKIVLGNTRVDPSEIANILGFINTENGKFTMVGPTGLEDEFSGIGFSLQDDLYHGADDGNIGALNMLEQATGNAAPVNALNYPFPDNINTIVTMDARPDTGELYSVLFSEIFIDGKVESRITDPEEFLLTTIDPLSGDVEIIGRTPDQLRAIAFPNKKIVNTPIPTLSEWGLIAMAGILGLVGFMVMRRKKVTV